MKEKEFVSALKDQTADIHVSSRLRQKTLDAACGKEPIRMKKRIPALAMAVVLSVVFCATALALAARAGMLDYENLFYNTYIPENIGETIELDVYRTANDLVDVSIRELYYDGRTSRITVDVKAKDEGILLAGFDTSGRESWSWLNQLNPESDPDDARTVAEVFTQGDYTASYNVYIGLVSEELHTGSGDYFYTAPGVLTFFLTDSYLNDLPVREVDFIVTLTPLLDSEGNPIEDTPGNTIRTEETLTLTSSATEEKVYVSAGPVKLCEGGVTVDQMQLFVKPQELYVRLYYTVGAGAPYSRTLALELFDPAVITNDLYAQRLKDGPTGDISTRLLSVKGELPEKYLAEFTLGLNELKDSYNIRAFNFADKTFYGSAEITMREATETDIAAFPAE